MLSPFSLISAVPLTPEEEEEEEEEARGGAERPETVRTPAASLPLLRSSIMPKS